MFELVSAGTDTMAYTASALAFMLENLGKTVVVTGTLHLKLHIKLHLHLHHSIALCHLLTAILVRLTSFYC